MNTPTDALTGAKRHRLVTAALIVIGLLAGGALWSVWSRPEPAPAATYKLIDGKQLTTSGLNGQYVLVNFWATSCVTCVAEMPRVVQTYQKYSARGFEVVAVAMSYDRADYVLNFVKTREIPFPVALDVDGSVARAYGNVKITPMFFLIDAQGQVIKRWVGKPDFDGLDRLLDQRLPPKVQKT